MTQSTRITVADVHHIARLARLELTDEEVERFRDELSKILEYAAQLASLDPGEGAAPPAPPGGQRPLREDRPEPWPDPERLHAEAPDFAGGYFRVPRVVE